MNTDNKILISVVSPVYRAEKVVDELVQRITAEVSKITSDFEIVLVDDGSPDKSWEKIQEICSKENRVKGISLSRNFGQHFAITAGLSNAQGKYVVMMDCDLQDDPVYIPQLFEKIKEGYDIVYAKKRARNHGFLKDLFAVLFYKILSWISDFRMDPNIGNYSILSRKAVDAFLRFNDYRRGYLMVLKWIGFKNSYVLVEHSKRKEGKSSYSLFKLIYLALNLSLSYSDKPLRMSIYAGITFSFLSFLGAIVIIYKYYTSNIIAGWTSIMVLFSLIGGLLMIFIGIIGLYLSKVFEQSKNRPLFLIQETLNLHDRQQQ
jgi:polyisoprenyl-phosphate glycosyltransferase